MVIKVLVKLQYLKNEIFQILICPIDIQSMLSLYILLLGHKFKFDIMSSYLKKG
jgi:hypothetical protein